VIVRLLKEVLYPVPCPPHSIYAHKIQIVGEYSIILKGVWYIVEILTVENLDILLKV
jgi:hypothetical protein